ncbi:MAG: LptF/LptG family permease [Pseudomonadota bacterium]
MVDLSAGASSPSRARRGLRLGARTLDRYLISLMARPMLAALAVAMIALMLERFLRMFGLISGQHAGLLVIATMLANLVPHYLGLALPAAFCIGMIATLNGLARRHELDAMEAAGWSLRRVGAAFVASGVILSILALLLFGFAQPYARYAYREARHALVAAGWNGRVEEGVFVHFGDGTLLSAGRVGADGRTMAEVVLVVPDDGAETVVTARRGLVVPEPDARTVRLQLEHGVSMGPGGVLRFDRLLMARRFEALGPFRPRGSIRELTLGELAAGAKAAEPARAAELRAELNGRLVRAVSLVGIALMSVPLGAARNRAPAWPRIALALAILTLYHHALTLAQESGARGALDPAFALWGICAVFTAGAGVAFARATSRGGGSRRRLAPGPR